MIYQKLSQQMIRIALVFLLLVGCSALGIGSVQPKPDETLVGTIAMEERANSAQITLKVSNDGQTFESVSFMFTELKCEGFSAGSSYTEVTGIYPITDGKIEITLSDIGEINGQFTSPTAAEGTIHLAFYNGQAECGTWKWSATSK
jgi:hypothetical protein